jgi:hypothetical protein
MNQTSRLYLPIFLMLATKMGYVNYGQAQHAWLTFRLGSFLIDEASEQDTEFEEEDEGNSHDGLIDRVRSRGDDGGDDEGEDDPPLAS